MCRILGIFLYPLFVSLGVWSLGLYLTGFTFFTGKCLENPDHLELPETRNYCYVLPRWVYYPPDGNFIPCRDFPLNKDCLTTLSSGCYQITSDNSLCPTNSTLGLHWYSYPEYQPNWFNLIPGSLSGVLLVLIIATSVYHLWDRYYSNKIPKISPRSEMDRGGIFSSANPK